MMAEKSQNRVDTIGVRKQDLLKLPTPVPAEGVSIKYLYPDLPQFIDSSQLSSSSDRSIDKCVSTSEVIQKKIDKLGSSYSKLLPNSKSLPCNTYQDLYSDLLDLNLPPIADYALSEDQSSFEEEIVKELPERLAYIGKIQYKEREHFTEFETPEVKLTKKQVKKLRVKEEKTREKETATT